VLCGQPATTFALDADDVIHPKLPEIPVAVPSEWLEHRPDIAGAERRMAAANADVGVATAAFFPRIILNGSAGFESVSASTLFDWPSHVWAVGPTLQWPLFTGGRNRAQLKSAKAAYTGTVASYRQTVLTAFQDVEDQLAAQKLLTEQLEREQEALVAARRALDVSNNRYKGGVEQYLDVITAQTAVLTHEQTVIQLRAQRQAASVALIKAMGAGWQSNAEAAAGGKLTAGSSEGSNLKFAHYLRSKGRRSGEIRTLSHSTGSLLREPGASIIRARWHITSCKRGRRWIRGHEHERGPIGFHSRVRPDDFSRRLSAVPSPAAHRQIHSAVVRRRTGSVDHVHVIFSDPAAGRICLCAFSVPIPEAPARR